VKFTPIHAANPGPYTGDGNWTYLIPGAGPILIDAGVGKPQHLDRLAEAAPDGPADVLVTHAHSDHSSGAPAIRARWSRTRFAKMPWPEKDARFEVAWRPLADGDRVATGEGVLEAIFTPGHSPDHLAFWHADSRTLFVGDLLIAGNTVFIPASSGGNLAAYLRSLHRLAGLQPAVALPAHGPAIEDPIAVIDRYLEHRKQREDQVLSALESGADSVDAITGRIYAAHSTALIPMARESVLAHLQKLLDEGRVIHEADRWLLPLRYDSTHGQDR
jgi:glyoxylase-like metal-dependent hydrolase (beta-lactamase superfamily II)